MSSLTGTANADSALGNDNPTLAYNMGSKADFATGMQFLDIMKMTRGWSAHEQPYKAGGMTGAELKAGGYYDDKGWLTEVPEGMDRVSTLWQWTASPEDPMHHKGVYIVEYEGKGTITMTGDARIISEEPGRFVFENMKGENISLTIYETDPEGTGDYIRDITVVREDHYDLYQAGGRFNPDWLELVQDAREMRFMDVNRTNNSNMTSWDQRIEPDGTYPGTAIAIEDMVALANEIGADPWFTIPHMADENYIRQFAIYVRDNLDPSLTAKVEYSNETWNWAFKQTHWLNDQAKAEWGETGVHHHYHTKKAVEVALIWNEVFGDTAEDRLSHVMGGQAVNDFVAEQRLTANAWKRNEPDAYVDPATIFDEIAITTYFGGETVSQAGLRTQLINAIKDPDIDAAAWLTQKLLDPAYPGSIPDRQASWQENADLAERMGMKLTAYEGGQHLHHSFAVSGLDPADLDILTKFMGNFVRGPEMAILYEENWKAWAAVSDGPFMQFKEIGESNKWGSWGLREHLNDENPRTAMLENLNATTKPWWEGAEGGEHYQQGVTLTGTAEGDLITGTSQEDYLIGKGGNDLFVAGRGNDGINGGDGIDRLILNGDAGDYVVRAEGKGYRIVGPDGSDFVINVEELMFDNNRLAVLSELAENADGTLRLPVTPLLDTEDIDADQGDFIDGSTHEAIYIKDLSGKGAGVEIHAIASNSDMGKQLGLNKSGIAYHTAGNADAPTGTGPETGSPFTAVRNLFQDVLPDADLDSALSTGAVIKNARKIVATEGNDGFFGRGDVADHVSGMGGNDVMLGRMGQDRLEGGDGRDWLIGGRSHDTLFGDADDDRLHGGSGNDGLYGGSGNDRLFGGGGADTIEGGSGDDVMVGGHGKDRFMFELGSGNDRIRDFTGEDTLVLRDFLDPGTDIAAAISAHDNNLLITNGEDRITLIGLNEADLEWVVPNLVA